MLIQPEEGPDMNDFVVVEDGTYTLRVAEVRERLDEDGRPSWMLRLELVDGPMAGRTAVTDWLNFGQRGMHRVRLVLSALGYDTSVPFDLKRTELLGKVARVELRAEESQDPKGRNVRRSRVPYGGWSPVPDGETFDSSDEDEGAEVGASSSGGGGGHASAADSMPF